MSQYKVYTESGIHSVAFDTLDDAKEWAHEVGGNLWFEIVDLVTCKIVYTAEDYDMSNYYAGA